MQIFETDTIATKTWDFTHLFLSLSLSLTRFVAQLNPPILPEMQK